MENGKVLHIKYINSVLSFLKENRCILLLTAFFLTGLISGTFIYKNNENIFNFVVKFSEDFVNTRTGESFIVIFLKSLLFQMIFLSFIFIMGTSVTGITFVPIAIFIRGALVGGLTGNIYSVYALNGIVFNAVIIIPTTVISIIALIIGAEHSLVFSKQVSLLTFPNSKPRNLSYAFKYLCIKFLILCIPIIVSALLDAWLSRKLIPYFLL